MDFAPRDNPEIASASLAGNGSFGGVHAAPRATAIYQAYYHTRAEAPTTRGWQQTEIHR
ncbi:MAG TPA: hypothetical protein VIC84_00305 [Blastocatellia bacterium]